MSDFELAQSNINLTLFEERPRRLIVGNEMVAPMHSIMDLNHMNIITTAVEETVNFYENNVGLRAKKRPKFREDGAWLYLEDRPLVHVILANGDTQGVRSSEATLSHYAFEVDDIDALPEHLKINEVKFDELGGAGDQDVASVCGRPERG